MLKDAIDGLVDSIIANIDGFSGNNCKGFDDETAIDYILRHDLSPKPQQCCIVSYGGIRRSDQISEFGGGRLIKWILVVSAMWPIAGSEEDYNDQLTNGYNFIDDIMNLLIVDPTLNNKVMDIDILDAEPFMEYVRNGANRFLLLSMRFVVTENLS